MASPEFKYNMDALRQEALDLAELCKDTRDLFESVQHGMDAQYKCEELRQDMLRIKRMLGNMSGCWPVICKSYSGSILPSEAALHEDTAQPSAEPAAATDFPVLTAVSGLGPEPPEHAAVKAAISSNADEATVEKAKAAFVDHVLSRAETRRPSYGPSDFNADDPMSFIRYLMRHVAALEVKLGNLEDKVKAYPGKGANVRGQLDALRRRIVKMETEMHPGNDAGKEPREDPYEDGDDHSMLFSKD